MGSQQRVVLPERVSVAVVSLRTLEADDVRYALAGVDDAEHVVDALERLVEPGSWVANLKFGHDLVRLSITHVDDVPVPPPYLPKSTYMGWSVRTLEFLRMTFEHLHPRDVFLELLRRARVA